MQEEWSKIVCTHTHTHTHTHLKSTERTLLAVQWLRLHLTTQGVWVRSLVGELRSHVPWHQKNPRHKTETIL